MNCSNFWLPDRNFSLWILLYSASLTWLLKKMHSHSSIVIEHKLTIRNIFFKLAFLNFHQRHKIDCAIRFGKNCSPPPLPVALFAAQSGTIVALELMVPIICVDELDVISFIGSNSDSIGVASVC